MKKPEILVSTDYFLPGYKGGGPIRTLVNMIEHLGDEYNFKVITRDRDLGDKKPYSGLSEKSCRKVGKTQVLYRSEKCLSLKKMRKEFLSIRHDLLYLNSLFSPIFTIKILILRKLRMIRRVPVVLAPRGEFSQGAISLKFIKKRIFLWVAKVLGIYNDVIWQASSQYEEQDIRRWFGVNVKVVIAPDMAPVTSSNGLFSSREGKTKNKLKVVFLSRISPKKNLDGLLNILAGVKKDVHLNIYGPIEDSNYWAECERIIGALPPNIRVEYRGAIPHEMVPKVFEAHDLFFFPTHGENFGHVVLEALVAGCPVLLSDQTPWRNLEEKGIGWDIPLDEPELYRQALEACCAMTDEVFQSLSQRSREYGFQCLQDKKVLELNRLLFNNALT